MAKTLEMFVAQWVLEREEKAMRKWQKAIEQWAKEAMALFTDIDEQGFHILQPQKQITELIARYPSKETTSEDG